MRPSSLCAALSAALIAARPRTIVAMALAAWLCAPLGARAEKADRNKPMVVESDGRQAATVDLKSRTTMITGHVIITQGTLVIKADRVDVREEDSGRFHALAIGSAGTPATFRQKRDRVDEVVEAEAERIEYDGSNEKVRFLGDAKLRVVRASGPPDEANASLITYDQATDTIVFEGASPAASGAADGRARLIFIPRQPGPGASEPAR